MNKYKQMFLNGEQFIKKGVIIYMKKGKIKKESFIEKIGKKILDPVIIFMSLYAIVINCNDFYGWY